MSEMKLGIVQKFDVLSPSTSGWSKELNSLEL